MTVLEFLLLGLGFAGTFTMGYLTRLWVKMDRAAWRSVWHCANGCGPTKPEIVEQFVCRNGHRFTKKQDWLEAV